MIASYIGYVISQIDPDFLGGVSVVSEGEEARENIATYTQISIPENATEIYFDYYAWQDYEAHMRFELAPREVHEWLITGLLCFDLPLDANSFPHMENDLLSWWQPATAEIFLVGQQCGNNPYYNILVDQTNSNTWIIYIYVYTV